jgi:alpha-beta hydrolase superfamily lysophospholipase
MVLRTIFDVERDIDIPESVFPDKEALREMEAPLDANGGQHGWFESSHQKERLHYRKFLPVSTPKAIVVFQHGLQSQSGLACVLSTGRKTNVALLTHEYQQAGYAVYTPDLIGHGFSEGIRHVMPSNDILIKDLLNCAKLVAGFHEPKTPVFLAGESLGGNLALQVSRYIQENPESLPNFQGAILFSPAIYPDTIYAPSQYVLKFCLIPVLGNRRPPSLIPSPVHPKFIWRDEERLAIGMKKDGISNHGAHPPYTSLLTLTTAMRKVREKTIPGLKVPFCVVHGAKDRAIPIKGAEFLVKTTSTSIEDFSYKRYEDALHDLLAEPEAPDVMGFTLAWIRERLEL